MESGVQPIFGGTCIPANTIVSGLGDAPMNHNRTKLTDPLMNQVLIGWWQSYCLAAAEGRR